MKQIALSIHATPTHTTGYGPDMDGYDGLLVAIIRQAAEDWAHPETCETDEDKGSAHTFFDGFALGYIHCRCQRCGKRAANRRSYWRRKAKT